MNDTPCTCGRCDECQKAALSVAARAMGRKGGLKGGVARARKLTPQRRSDIASDAAIARWYKSKLCPGCGDECLCIRTKECYECGFKES